MDRMKTLKALANGESIEKGVSLSNIAEVGVLASKLHKALTAPERPPSTVELILDQLKQLVKKSQAPVEDSADTLQFISTPVVVDGAKIAKSVNQDKGLITAIILRPDEADLHGDIYSADEVEKACHNFNTVCRQTNIQHTKMADFDMVESFIAPADFELGEGIVKAGDWLGTMFIDPLKHQDTWSSVKSGDFTGFSIGCKANVEKL